MSLSGDVLQIQQFFSNMNIMSLFIVVGRIVICTKAEKIKTKLSFFFLIQCYNKKAQVLKMHAHMPCIRLNVFDCVRNSGSRRKWETWSGSGADGEIAVVPLHSQYIQSVLCFVSKTWALIWKYFWLRQNILPNMAKTWLKLYSIFPLHRMVV